VSDTKSEREEHEKGGQTQPESELDLENRDSDDASNDHKRGTPIALPENEEGKEGEGEVKVAENSIVHDWMLWYKIRYVGHTDTSWESASYLRGKARLAVAAYHLANPERPGPLRR